MNLISETLRTAICQQIAHEIQNANIYFYMCGFLKNKGLDNLAAHFEKQREEEHEHSKEFFNLLTDLNADIFIPEIDEVNYPFPSMTSLAKAYLDREVLTTTSIKELKNLAIEEDNPVVEQKMRDMISKQQGEYEEATTFMDNAMLCGDDWWHVMMWDKSIS